MDSFNSTSDLDTLFAKHFGPTLADWADESDDFEMDIDTTVKPTAVVTDTAALDSNGLAIDKNLSNFDAALEAAFGSSTGDWASEVDEVLEFGDSEYANVEEECAAQDYCEQYLGLVVTNPLAKAWKASERSDLRRELVLHLAYNDLDERTLLVDMDAAEYEQPPPCKRLTFEEKELIAINKARGIFAPRKPSSLRYEIINNDDEITQSKCNTLTNSIDDTLESLSVLLTPHSDSIISINASIITADETITESSKEPHFLESISWEDVEGFDEELEETYVKFESVEAGIKRRLS